MIISFLDNVFILYQTKKIMDLELKASIIEIKSYGDHYHVYASDKGERKTYLGLWTRSALEKGGINPDEFLKHNRLYNN